LKSIFSVFLLIKAFLIIAGLDWLLESVPGQPGTDYPILAEVPETAFACDGLVDGGK
jgi:hypothetical protein